MVRIRLARKGAKKNPFYHIIATDKRNARDGRYNERLGYFNPLARGSEIRLHMNIERVDYWLHNGAQPSDKVRSLIKGFRQDPSNEKYLAKRTELKAKADAEKAAAKQAELDKKAAEEQAAEAAKQAEASAEATETSAKPEAEAKPDESK
ncbi:MAG: 30S ribosomal protein S16 [Pseudomonadota bacterium]